MDQGPLKSNYRHDSHHKKEVSQDPHLRGQNSSSVWSLKIKQMNVQKLILAVLSEGLNAHKYLDSKYSDSRSESSDECCDYVFITFWYWSFKPRSGTDEGQTELVCDRLEIYLQYDYDFF